MNRMKTLSLPVVSALLASLAVPASGQLVLELSTQKSYRQDAKSMQFKGGTFEVNLSDGDGVFTGSCARTGYWPPNIPMDPCPLGATAFLSYGNIDSTNLATYFSVTSVIPAIAIEPRRPDLAFLRAAPPSRLQRPLADFTDTSFSLYYNLHTTSIREYIISRYSSSRTYGPAERSRFETEIVPGVYYYSFPRLNNPILAAPISAVIYPMPEGRAVKNSQWVGVDFTTVSGKAPVWRNGFMELSFNKPNVLRWRGFDPSSVFASADKLYLSIRVLSDSRNPKSETDLVDVEGLPQSIFPGFTNGGDPRILLGNPYVSSFTTPPIFPSGTRGVLELELQRNLSTTGVTFDGSNRKFQIPVIVVNRYTEYAQVTFPKLGTNTAILADFDKDGFNNLTEWILGSNPGNRFSVPVNPVPQAIAATLTTPAAYGFNVVRKLETVPAVTYILQRSVDGGASWQTFESDTDWTVTSVTLPAGALNDTDPERSEIVVRSNTGLPPAGTATHQYRVKIVQAN